MKKSLKNMIRAMKEQIVELAFGVIIILLIYIVHLDDVANGRARDIDYLKKYIHKQAIEFNDTINQKDSIIVELQDSIKNIDY